MFHLHIVGSGCSDYWDLSEKRKLQAQLMGDWFGQLKPSVKRAFLSILRVEKFMSATGKELMRIID